MEARDRQTKEGMPDRQLASEVLTIIVAGHETTATTLAWVWYLLSQNENVEQALSSELAALTGDDPPHPRDLQRFVYASRVIDEALRLCPPGWLMTRKALADDQLAATPDSGMQTHLVMIAKSLRLRYLEAKPLDLNPGINLRNKHDFIMRPESKSAG
jgi:cytochrome P450